MEVLETVIFSFYFYIYLSSFRRYTEYKSGFKKCFLYLPGIFLAFICFSVKTSIFSLPLFMDIIDCNKSSSADVIFFEDSVDGDNVAASCNYDRQVASRRL